MTAKKQAKAALPALPKVRDSSYVGCDSRLLDALEVNYGQELSRVTRDNIHEVFIKAIRTQGLKDSANLRDFIVDLVEFAAAEIRDAKPKPLGRQEQTTRRRIPLLKNELHAWLLREQEAAIAKAGSLDAREREQVAARIQPRYRAAEGTYDDCWGWEQAATNIDLLEGTTPGTIRHWCESNAIAKEMVATFRPVRIKSALHDPQAQNPLEGLVSALITIGGRN